MITTTPLFTAGQRETGIRQISRGREIQKMAALAAKIAPSRTLMYCLRRDFIAALPFLNLAPPVAA